MRVLKTHEEYAHGCSNKQHSSDTNHNTYYTAFMIRGNFKQCL